MDSSVMEDNDSSSTIDWDSTSCYRVSFESTIAFALDQYHNYFNVKEIEDFRLLLSLSPAVMCLLSRVIGRKTTWLRVESLIKYIPSLAKLPVPGLFNAIDELVNLKILEKFGNKSPDSSKQHYDEDQIRDVLVDVPRKIEIKALAKIFDVKITGTKLESINLLLKKLAAQRSFMSKSSLIQRIPISLKKALVDSAIVSHNQSTTIKVVRDDRFQEIVRVNPYFLTLIRRAQRLLQISSKNSMSTMSPANSNTPLLVSFKKIRFAPYTCNINGSLFETLDHFILYEASSELLFCYEKAKSIDKARIDNSEASKFFLSIVVQKFNLHIVSVLQAVDKILSGSAQGGRSFQSLVNAYEALIGNFNDKSSESYLTYEIMVGIVSTFCYIRLCEFNALLPKSSTPKPRFLNRFNPGYILTYQVIEFVSYLEKEVYGRRYELATSLLLFLLRMNHVPLKRGKIYIRLVVDFEHLNNATDARTVLVQGLNDPDVKFGDRLNLEKRWELYKDSSFSNRNEVSSIYTSDVFSDIEENFVAQIKRFFFENHLSEATNGSSNNAIIDLSLDEASDSSAFINSWSCDVCTLINELKSLSCNACGSGRKKPEKKLSKASACNIALIKKETKSTNFAVPIDSCDSNVSGKRPNDSKAKPSKRQRQSADIEDNDPSESLVISHDSDEQADDVELSSELRSFVPKEFTIYSRRFGNTKANTGKSKFVGSDDVLVNVEQFVMNKCYKPESDDEEFTDFMEVIDGGGWQGWHCEGSYLRSLFGLLFWDVIFYSEVPNTFLTPYQDYPLDLGFDSFYFEREPIITELCFKIERMTSSELIKFIGDNYRAHYKTECLLISWYHPLHHLQLIGASMGGRALSYIFLQMVKNYHYYRSGMPDLLLVRVKRLFDSQSYVPLNEILGENWNERPESVNDFEKKYKYKSKDRDVDNKESTNIPESDKTVVDKNSSLLSMNRSSSQSTEAESFVDEIQNEVLLLDEEETQNDVIQDIEDTEEVSSKFDRFRCTTADLQFPGEQGDDSSSSESINIDRLYNFEAMFVEVKGPTDILSDKQVIFLSTLSKAGVKAYVGRVKESKLKQAVVDKSDL